MQMGRFSRRISKGQRILVYVCMEGRGRVCCDGCCFSVFLLLTNDFVKKPMVGC